MTYTVGMYYYILGVCLLTLLLWIIGSYVVIWSVAEPTYTVREQRDGYEIRDYAPYIKAETTVTGNYEEATSAGFRIIADYIFGNNTKQTSIAMTTPVLEQTQQVEKISMTTPVLESANNNGSRTIAFILPAEYTLDTLPTPNNDAVKIMPVPARTVAVLRFTGYPTEQRINQKKIKLQEHLTRDQVISTGPIETARYNPPLSFPLMLRNEILIPIE